MFSKIKIFLLIQSGCAKWLKNQIFILELHAFCDILNFLYHQPFKIKR